MRAIILFLSVIPFLFMVNCSEESPSQNPQSNNYGKLVLKSIPPGARIDLMGTYTGKITPDSISNLEPGTYEVSLYLVNYDSSYFTATIFANITTTKNIALIDSLPPVEFQWGWGFADSVFFHFRTSQDILMDSIIVNRPIDASGNYINEKYLFYKELFQINNYYYLPFICNGQNRYPRFSYPYKFDVYGQKAYGSKEYFHMNFERTP